MIASMRTIIAQSASLLASLETVWGIAFGVLLLGDILNGFNVPLVREGFGVVTSTSHSAAGRVPIPDRFSQQSS